MVAEESKPGKEARQARNLFRLPFLFFFSLRKILQDTNIFLKH